MKPLHLRHARRKLSAARDDNGVPHIAADSWPDALYGLGYMHALDRPTQMLFARTIALGRSAELIADQTELAETDRFFRRAGLYLRSRSEVRRTRRPARSADVTAYCEGVNDGMCDAGRSLPMWAVGFHPSPWNQQVGPADRQSAELRRAGVGQQQNERLILELIQAGVDDAQLRELFSPLLDQADFELLRRVKISSQLSDEALELITDLPRLAGSNAWAVAPSRSASGAAMLGLRSAFGNQPLAGHLVRGGAPLGRSLCAGGHAARLPAVCRRPHRAAGLGRDVHEGRHERLFHRRLPAGGHDGLAISPRRGVARFLRFARKRFSAKARAVETLRVYFNPQGTLDADPEPTEAGLYLSTAWTGYDPGAGRSMATWLQ